MGEKGRIIYGLEKRTEDGKKRESKPGGKNKNYVGGVLTRKSRKCVGIRRLLR